MSPESSIAFRPADDLVHIDRGGRGDVPRLAQSGDPRDRRASAQEVDQNRRVQHVHTHGSSARATRVGSTLLPYPRGGIVVPVVALVVDRPGRSLDRSPAHLLTHSPLDSGPHEPAPAAGTGDPIDLGHQVVVELNVHTHVQRLAPSGSA